MPSSVRLPLLAFLLLLFFRFSYVTSSQRRKLQQQLSTKPCWCQSLREYVHNSIDLLEQRYTRQLLHLSTVFTSSGYDRRLEKRLLDVLNSRGSDSLKLGILGGSYSLPVHPHANAWAFNVTRWLNAALSSSVCTPSELLPATIRGVCSKGWCSPQDPYCADYYEGCATQASSYVEAGAVFCHPIAHEEDDLQRQAKYHRNAQSLDDICDNTVLPKRPCTIFGGSGKYATLNMASKGGTVTFDGVKSIPTISDEALDILIWDYGTNDVASGMDVYHNPVVQSFFQQAVRKYPNMSALAMVFWQDDTDSLSIQCKSKGYVTWSNDLCTADYPFIKNRFDPYEGSARDISFISASLPQFCRAANCSLNDIVQMNSAHPKDSGISLFADLFIWQLLYYFKKLLHNQCRELKDELRLRDTNYTTSGGLANVWVVDAHTPLLPYTSRFKEDIQRFSDDLPNLLSNPSESYIPVATFILYSPQLSSPLPTDQFAYLCTPGKVFNPMTTVKPIWTPVNIVAIMKAGCAGWMNSGFRDDLRADDNHMYIPASTAQCPAAGWPANKITLQALTHEENPSIVCPPPLWPSNDTYPHSPWKDEDNIPSNVKPVDILFRLSSSLEWDHLCYDYISCSPRIVWKDQISGFWKNFTLHTHNNRFNMKCYEKSEDVKMDLIAGGYMYLHLIADDCLPWHVFEDEKWHPARLESTISLIKSIK